MTAIKKRAGKLATLPKKAKGIPLKYSDKSAGQPQFVPVFNNIKNIIKKFEKNNFKPRDDNPGSYSLYYIAPIEVAGRKYDEICFVSLLMQKGYVGFYFFPIYINPELANFLGDGLIKCLKGKTCFHIKNNDEKILHEIDSALQTGFQFYLNQGWVLKLS